MCPHNPDGDTTAHLLNRWAVLFLAASHFQGRYTPQLPSFPATKIPFGNRALTMISVWLGT
jgi:hypothetical protein